MAHQHNEHRAHKVEHRRVGHILKGYGGHGDIGSPHRSHHTDEPEDRALVKAMVKPGALKHKAHGGKVKHRLDKPHRAKGGRVKHRDQGGDVGRIGKISADQEYQADLRKMGPPTRARGGKVKHGKTNVNVIVGHGGPQGAMPVPVPAAGPPAAVPRPPMPMAPPVGAAPGLPPGIGPGMAPPGAGMPPMGPRKKGGRTYAKGGRVGAMPGYESTKKHATPVQHTDGKFPYVHEKRGRQITYKRGGIVA